MMLPLRKTIPITMALSAYVLYIPSTHAMSSDAQRVSKLLADAKRGQVLAEIELAAHYLVGEGVDQDAAQAAHWYEKAAQQGNPDAQNEIGYFYQVGVGVPVDLARALNWYQLSASSGSAAAKLNLGVLYVVGLGVKKDVTLAQQLFEEAAKRGNGTAAAYLGNIYYFGLADKPDPSAAESWYQVGVKLHDPIAEYNMASLLSVVADHPHDLTKAAGLLRQSSALGYVPSMHSLGLLLIKHPEVEQTTHEARSLLEAAAEVGYWKSSILLGILDRDGQGTVVDKKAAAYHFQIAELQGGEEAVRLVEHDLQTLRSSLAEDQVTSIISTAQAWYAQHHSARTFIAGNSGSDKYFPLPENQELIKAAFVSRAKS